MQEKSPPLHAIPDDDEFVTSSLHLVPLHLIVTFCGYFGAVLLLASFAATSVGRLTTTSRGYHLVNVLGGSALLVSCAAQAAWPSAGLNLIWAAISLLTLAQTTVTRARARKDLAQVPSVVAVASVAPRKRRGPLAKRTASRPPSMRGRRSVRSAKPTSVGTVSAS